MWQALSIFLDAVESARPDRLLSKRWRHDLVPFSPGPGGRLILVAIGKASIPFARAVEDRFAKQAIEGVAVVPHGYSRFEVPKPHRVEILESGHPVPDEAGLQAARRVLELADGAREGDLFIAAVSGGGSALVPALPEAIALPEWQDLTRLLLHAGVPIADFNVVRRALSLTAGGRLAERASPARVVGLILSDVPGDDPGTVAGGPTVPSRDGRTDALEVLRRWRVTDRTPGAVLRVLEAGGVPPARSGPVSNRLIGSNRDAMEEAARAATAFGFEPVLMPGTLQGEARTVGARLAGEVLSWVGRGRRCLIWGGETTVTVRGRGRGGRNQELALSAAMEFEARPVEGVVGLLSAGTDGFDGPTPVAGAWVTPATVARARKAGFDAGRHLEDNDAFGFFERVGGHVVTGATHTNVMDLVLALVH